MLHLRANYPILFVKVFSPGNWALLKKVGNGMGGLRRGFDEHGNPASKAFDLGGVDDTRLEGERILFYIALTGGYFEPHLRNAVNERHLEMDVLFRKSSQCEITSEMLARYTQLWYLSDSSSYLRADQVQMIEQFVDAGNGLAIWADNDPYFADANLLAERITDTHFSGDKMADRILVPGTALAPGCFIEHPLTQGMNNLYEGITICTIAPAPHVTILGQSHDGQHCIGCYETEKRRVVLDTGFTKLYGDRFERTAGTARYLRNIGFWLARSTRNINYHQLTTARTEIPTIAQGASSAWYTFHFDTPTTATFILHWEGDAKLGLQVQDPKMNSAFVAHSETAPLRAPVEITQAGDWRCRVMGVRVGDDAIPYTLTLAIERGIKGTS